MTRHKLRVKILWLRVRVCWLTMKTWHWRGLAALEETLRR
jgi:hypothetical protein